MKYFFSFFLLLAFFSCTQVFAQIDSTQKIDTSLSNTKSAVQKIKQKSKLNKDTIAIDSINIALLQDLQQKAIDALQRDSLTKIVNKPIIETKDTNTYASIFSANIYNTNRQSIFGINKLYSRNNKDLAFYLLIFLVAITAFVRVAYPRYFKNLFNLFFQISLNRKVVKDQLLQNKFASLLLNIVFVVVASMYICIVFQQKNYDGLGYWWVLMYTTITLAVLYIGKYIFIQFTGWLFGTQEAADTYTFIVFLCNKMLAIVLLPLLFLLTFSDIQIATVAFTITYFLIGINFLYRYIASHSSLRTDLNVSGLHFFLYLCTIEILPLLLIYKGVSNYLEIAI